MKIKIILLLLVQVLARKRSNYIKAASNFTSLGYKCGFSVEEIDVQTEDGYILKMFHIEGDKRRPVLLLHGIVDSADTFILRGQNSLAATLAREGYDVWAANTRGSTYSRRHVTLEPSDKRFWEFTFHEVGYYDLPAFINHILKVNGVKKLSAVAHSQGNTNFYVLGATRPEYNEKVRVLTSLGPVCFLTYVPTVFELMIQSRIVINEVLLAFDEEEIFSPSLRKFIRYWCTETVMRVRICRDIFFELAGKDEQEFEEEFVPVVLNHYPTATSRRNIMHLAQISEKTRFSQYDFGRAQNLKVYNAVSAPEYDLGKVTMPVALFVGKNDKLTSAKDVRLLLNSLPNIVEYRQMSRDQFNHIDHVWGRNMDAYLFPHVLKVLKKVL
uniref:Lipase n=2 Tax=Bombyx mori TaxID=7091 RepID=A0A8R2DLT1_BOMMO|nr:lipase 1 [Bombyx mori]